MGGGLPTASQWTIIKGSWHCLGDAFVGDEIGTACQLRCSKATVSLFLQWTFVNVRQQKKMAEIALTAASARIVRLLIGKPPQSVADLVDATGVTRTAVTEQLNELVAAGLVERTTERLTGRGRPRHLYATHGASLQLLFAQAHRFTVPAIWKAISEIGGKELTTKIIKHVSHQLAESYKSRMTGITPAERLREFGDLLCEEGGLVDIREDNGQPAMYKRNCPFMGILDDERNICSIDMEMMTEVVGHPLSVACRLEGIHCCMVRLADEP